MGVERPELGLISKYGEAQSKNGHTSDAPGPEEAGRDDPDAGTARVCEALPRLDLPALLSFDRPAREWLWWRLVPERASVALVARAGTGKSLLLLALAVAITRGDRAFAGLRISRRRVFLVDMENTQDDIFERLRDLGVTPESAARLDSLVYLHLPLLPSLDTAAGGSVLLAALDAYDISAGDVVILDSIQRLTSGKENEADTIRAYYLHTGLLLKRREVTVIRTDNTGKDAGKGARGSSGKRDDVDVELIMEPTGQPGRVSLKPGKTRLPDIDEIILDQLIDDDGRIFYNSAGDPFRAKVVDAIAALDRHGVPIEVGERKAAEILKEHRQDHPRAALRVAIKERRHLQKRASEDSPAQQ